MAEPEMKGNMCIKCDCCKYARRDKKASDRHWTAYMCANLSSEYFGALLNITHSGYKCVDVCWTGCGSGEYGKIRYAPQMS